MIFNRQNLNDKICRVRIKSVKHAFFMLFYTLDSVSPVSILRHLNSVSGVRIFFAIKLRFDA